VKPVGDSLSADEICRDDSRRQAVIRCIGQFDRLLVEGIAGDQALGLSHQGFDISVSNALVDEVASAGEADEILRQTSN
jgi:hypothetical protein